MSIGYAGYSAVVMSFSEIEKFELKSYNRLAEEIKTSGLENDFDIYSLLNYGCYTKEDIDPEKAKRIMQLYDDFMTDFKYTTGIGVSIEYHDRDEWGDIYDEVDGFYFELNFNDVYQMTPEAKKLKEKSKFDLENFVHFG